MIRHTILLILLFMIFSFPGSIWAQEIGFMGMHLGMSRSEVIEKAESNDLIEVPKSRDVEFFPVEEREILALSITPEAPHIYLQFYDDILLSLTIVFDEQQIDYYTLIDRMEEKYGEHQRVTPSWREWEFEGALIKVEKPAVVKYMALEELVERAALKRQEAPTSNERKAALLEGL